MANKEDDAQHAFNALLAKADMPRDDPEYMTVCRCFREAVNACEIAWVGGELVLKTGYRRPGSGVRKARPATEERPCPGCGADLLQGQNHDQGCPTRGGA
jgi:hypothetical protein